MSKILKAVTTALDELNDSCGCPKFSLFLEGDDIVIPVPRTRRGRELFRSLLLETGRMERDDMRFRLTAFAKMLKDEGTRIGMTERIAERITTLENEVKMLQFMVDNGLGPEDMEQ